MKGNKNEQKQSENNENGAVGNETTDLPSELVSKVSRFLQFSFLDSRIEESISRFRSSTWRLERRAWKTIGTSIAASIFNPKLSFSFLFNCREIRLIVRKNDLGQPIGVGERFEITGPAATRASIDSASVISLSHLLLGPSTSSARPYGPEAPPYTLWSRPSTKIQPSESEAAKCQAPPNSPALEPWRQAESSVIATRFRLIFQLCLDAPYDSCTTLPHLVRDMWFAEFLARVQ
ncbi:hypothetical protein M9H77_02127 [Catharanthus roseus]|uniref:Uncharacterized protein n=1 Tax=Catharanthus roseus TaxID=4058 RepID=A0ACC0C7H6_CATRO|nr:hypothetical protein M9H77_02127 [Catharanthus roseus]